MTSARSREGGSALHISLTDGGLGGGKEGCLGLRREGGDVTERQKPYCAALSLRSMETEKGEIVKSSGVCLRLEKGM